MLRRHGHRIVLAVVLAGFALIVVSAMRHTSTTFDEILLPSAGARGFETGRFDLVTLYHPPLLQYAYGLPVAVGNVVLPPEGDGGWNDALSFRYSRALYFEAGNDPEILAFRARLVAVLLGTLLVLATYLFTRATAGVQPALLSAILVAFVPDVLAHSGISYNDVPLALAVLLALWATDAAVRDPKPWRAALCGLTIGLALGVKFSAIALGPAVVLIVAMEASARWRDREWLRKMFLQGAPVVVVALLLTLIIVYRGDILLREFRAGLLFNIAHANLGHGAPAVLLGRYSTTGWWYFFPLAFFLKTSVGLHILLAIALIGAWVAREPSTWNQRALSRLRVPVIGALVFLGFVMAARLNIGFRHAMPIIPFVCILVACGVWRAWSLRLRLVQGIVVAALAWHVIAPLRVYPYFISYLSEYAGSAEYSYETLVDSSYDWGQGLIGLREFMREENIPYVLLSYFGSASPSAYGVDYLPLPSFFPLREERPTPSDAPRWIAVSATNLAGNYLVGDPLGRLRDIEPYRIVGGSIFVFEIDDE